MGDGPAGGAALVVLAPGTPPASQDHTMPSPGRPHSAPRVVTHSARRPFAGLVLALAAALLAGAARAEEVHEHYTGKVSGVLVFPGPTLDALTAHGVVQDASADVDFTYESTTLPTFTSGTTTSYN